MICSSSFSVWLVESDIGEKNKQTTSHNFDLIWLMSLKNDLMTHTLSLCKSRSSPSAAPRHSCFAQWALRCLKINVRLEVEGRSESDLPAGQRCTAGYWLVAVASQGASRQRWSTQILLTEALEPLTSGKAERHFIIRRDEIHFHSRYTKTHSEGVFSGGFELRTKKIKVKE